MSQRISAGDRGGPGRPRAVIADDHALIADGLAGLIAPLVEVVATVRDGLSAIAAIRRHRPGLAVIDPNLPLAHGSQVHAGGAAGRPPPASWC